MAAAVVTPDEIRAALEASASFAPVARCDVVDVTGGGACGAKFELVLVSAKCEGVGALDRQRLVHAALGAPLMGRIHALSFLSSPAKRSSKSRMAPKSARWRITRPMAWLTAR